MNRLTTQTIVALLSVLVSTAVQASPFLRLQQLLGMGKTDVPTQEAELKGTGYGRGYGSYYGYGYGRDKSTTSTKVEGAGRGYGHGYGRGYGPR